MKICPMGPLKITKLVRNNGIQNIQPFYDVHYCKPNGEIGNIVDFWLESVEILDIDEMQFRLLV